MAANHRYFTFEAPLICQRLPGTTVKDDRSISDPYLQLWDFDQCSDFTNNMQTFWQYLA